MKRKPINVKLQMKQTQDKLTVEDGLINIILELPQ